MLVTYLVTEAKFKRTIDLKRLAEELEKLSHEMRWSTC